MVDIAGLLGAPGPADFSFRAGNHGSLATWVTATEPLAIGVRVGAGASGSDRVTLIWKDNNLNDVVESNESAARQWLQVTVKANATTGLATDDVFYFGNAPGEVGNSPVDAVVDTTDVLAAFNGQTPANGAALVSTLDFNRDRVVDTTDVLLAFNQQTGFGSALVMLNLAPGDEMDGLPGSGVTHATALARLGGFEGCPERKSRNINGSGPKVCTTDPFAGARPSPQCGGVVAGVGSVSASPTRVEAPLPWSLAICMSVVRIRTGLVRFVRPSLGRRE